MAKTRQDIIVRVINKILGAGELVQQQKYMNGLNKSTQAVSKTNTILNDGLKKTTVVTGTLNKQGQIQTRTIETVSKFRDREAEATTRLANRQMFLSTWSNKLGVSASHVNKIMSVQGITFNKQNKVIDIAGRNIGDLNGVMRRGSVTARGFNFAWLSVMFAGMALTRVFGGLIKAQLQLFGITELFSAVFTILLLPLMELLLPLFLKLAEVLMDLPSGMKMAIGVFTLFGFLLGIILMVIGQIALAFGGFMLLFMKVPIIAKLVLGFGASLGTILLVIGAVIAIGLVLYIAWKKNFLGMRNTVSNFVSGIKQQIGGIIGIFKGVFSILKGIVTGDFTAIKDGIVLILRGLFDFMIGNFKITFNAIVILAKGALMIIYNLIKVVIDGIIWIANKTSKFIGGGQIDFKMPSFQTGGIIPATGPYLLHKGETVTPAGGTTNVSPTINVNATISSDYDVRRLSEELKRYWVEDFDRLSQGRGNI